MTAEYLVNEDVVFRRMGEELILVHLRTNQIHTLNPTAARLWELLAAGRDLAEIRRTLLEEFEVGEEQVEREVGRLLAELESSRLIHPRGDG